ncbi:MAG TPA: class I SAM-dependent methyltransferase, partial [Kofleriaceae bacterium]
LRVTTESLIEIISRLQPVLARGEVATLEIPDPNAGAGHHAGELVGGAVHRPWRVWIELADRLAARLEIRGTTLAFAPLERTRVIRSDYSASSEFARVHKLEDPSFVIDFAEALDRANLRPDATVLAAGCNRADELALVYRACTDARVTGIDLDDTALAIARTAWPRATFVAADLARPLAADRFDLVIAIGLLQSGALDDRDLLRRLVQDHLAPTGAIILGVPNSRHVDGEVSYGARMRNFSQPELGLLVKDLAFYRKYLQQHHRTVHVTGRNTLFVTAVTSP